MDEARPLLPRARSSGWFYDLRIDPVREPLHASAFVSEPSNTRLVCPVRLWPGRAAARRARACFIEESFAHAPRYRSRIDIRSQRFRRTGTGSPVSRIFERPIRAHATGIIEDLTPLKDGSYSL